MKQLVVFDLDGTLLNTIADLATATNQALKACGFPTHATDVYKNLVGGGITKLFERALPEDMRTPKNVERLRPHFLEYYNAHSCDLTEPYPGIVELLQELRSNKISVAVASNKYQSGVDRLVRHYFPTIEWAAIEGQKEGVPVKPDPSIVFEILGKCPTPKAEVLYVGDSGVDMETARRAGVYSVGVTWGFRTAEELRAHYADKIVDSPNQIFELAKL
ncbi:MAG: HAD family hydrolase [Paramuribaculum sp.]|nr:HAD family hydrolase [Paramuribaculum sp.]